MGLFMANRRREYLVHEFINTHIDERKYLRLKMNVIIELLHENLTTKLQFYK